MTKHCRLPGCHDSRKWLASAKLEGARAESMHCSRHACRTLEGYPDAVPCSNVAIPGTRYCGIHPSCTVQNCDSQRSPNHPFCHNHTCAVQNCPHPAAANRRCPVHMPCPVQGCPRFLQQRPDGRGWYIACRVHIGKRCDFAGCSTKVGLNETYCGDHICTVKGCPERKASSGSNCQNHTCAINGCPLPVAHPDQVRPNHHGCAYCIVHECGTGDCHVVATVAHGHCPAHGCRIRGCNNAKSPDESLGGYCFSHISEDMYKRAERAGRNAEFNDAILRKEEQMDRQRELERIQKELDERMRLEEEVESLKLENLRLQVENASVADHYTTDQHSHRHSAESPRSGSFRFDLPRSSFSSHRRISDHIYDIPRSRGYDDDDSVISGSTDDVPIRPRRTTSIRYVRR